ncbi:unnamed protein product [Rhizophagus irregularis]|nr:unnamed protein product [Rhizophagus irregularis]
MDHVDVNYNFCVEFLPQELGLYMRVSRKMICGHFPLKCFYLETPVPNTPEDYVKFIPNPQILVILQRTT